VKPLSRRARRRRCTTLLSACAVLAAGLLPAGPAGAAGASGESVASSVAAAQNEPPRTWAAPDKATLRPGRVLETSGAFCTGNFVFTDAAGHVYLGQAAHCSAKGAPTDFNGCKDQSLPLGTKVTVLGANVRGTLAYNSWLAMQEAGEKNLAACRNNDFALVRLPDDAQTHVNPSIPVFGGPKGVNSEGVRRGEAVFSYGNSPLRANIGLLAPKRGGVIATVEDGWAHLVLFATPGVPGDSGSAVLDSSGRAVGVLSSLNLYPFAASNGVSDMGRMLAYARAHSGIKGLRLVEGTVAFTS
jgi:hypothetical protein